MITRFADHRIVVCTLAFLLISGVARANGDVFDQFYRYIETKNRIIEPHLPGETIDYFTGTLTISQEDLSLPGKGGLDLRLIRTYSSKIWGRADQFLLGEPLLAYKEPTMVGFGWSMNMGRLRSPTPAISGPPGKFPVYEGPIALQSSLSPIGPGWNPAA